MEVHRTNQATHLTDAQLTELLLGTNPPAVRAHLEACPQCAKEAEQVSGAIAGFDQQSRLWAERRAASQPAMVSHRDSAFSWLHRPQAWTAAALAIALATGIGISVHHDRALQVQQAVDRPQPAMPQPSPATLKADNDLLTAINGELRADESASASVYGLTTASHVTRGRATKRISE
jgi:hypothetical protein